MFAGLIYLNRREARSNAAFFAFTLCLAISSAVLVAYVVTNLGALIRLRLMCLVPLWAGVIAFGPSFTEDPPVRRDS
jgi:hypothetical protein